MKRCLMILTCLSFCSMAFAADTVSLKHDPDFTKGKVIKSETETTTEQTLTIAGMALDTTSSTFAIAKSEVVDDTEGAAKLSHEFEVFQISVNVPGGGEISYDSGSEDAPPEGKGPLESMKQYFHLLANIEWVSTHGPDAKVVKIEFVGDPQSRAPEMFKSEVTPERWIRETNIQYERLPTEPVKVGDTWTRDSEADLGSDQKFYLTTEYKYVGQEEHNGKPLHHITSKTKTVKYEIGDNTTLPLALKKSDLTIESSSGNVWYDPAKRVAVESDHKMHIVGDLTLVINGMEFPSELDLTMSNRTATK